MRHPLPLCCALGAALMLAACSDTKYRTITTTVTGGADPAAVAAAQERADAAEMALDELRASLAAAQAALTPGTTAQQREQARDAVMAAREDLKVVREMLTDTIQPPGTARSAADAALAAVDTALARTAEALQAMGDTASAGPLQLATMHPSLDTAQAALDAAQVRLGEALEANPSGALRNLLAQAQATLTTAQVSLVPLLREELAARAAERDAARGERDALRDEHVSPPLFGNIAPRTLEATITVTRTARAIPNADGDAWIANPDALEIATDAIPYAAGTTLTARAGDEEFPMRAITFRGDIRQGSQRGKPPGAEADNAGRFPIVQGPLNTLGNAADHTKNAVVSSIQLSQDGGLVLKAGGSGIVFNEFQWDIRGTEGDGPDGIPGDGGATTATAATAFHIAMFRRAGETPPTEGDMLTQAQADMLTGWAEDNCSGVTFPCWDGNMRDLTIAFGTPSPDPDGEAGYHWTSKIPSSEGQPRPEVGDAMHRWATSKVGHFADPGRGAGEYRGEYRLWLSHYAGLDSGATDAESDDSHHYLQYAAYGLFTFTDYLTSNIRPARMQGFHFGYDAFADAPGMKVSDLATPIMATFTGRSAAMVMEPHSDRSQVERLIRVRGDITLEAVIGGANTITGEIANFETPSGRAWGPYAPLTDSVRLTNGAIAADGSYTGDTTVHGAASHLWDNGAFGGNFYGNSAGPDLETAGWFYLTGRGYTPPSSNPLTGEAARDYPGRPDFRYSGIFGSFGAVCSEGCE